MGEEILDIRRQKIEALREAGVNPFPYAFARTHTVSQVREQFDELMEQQQAVRVAGRVMLHRVTGKLTFFQAEDQDARMQLSGRLDELGAEAYARVKQLDVGDIVGVEGVCWRTRTGEPTIGVQKLELLCKNVRPLPEKWHGLRDKEIRYRQRDLDWIVNGDVRQTFVLRARALHEVRRFMDAQGFLEVDVPYIQMTYGGGEARPFVVHINAIDTDAYLSISPEIFLKRYIVGGFHAVYSIARNFRNEGIDATHNPEFTMMEAYQAFGDYQDAMRLFEQLFEHVFKALLGTTKIVYQGQEIDVAAPWQRMRVYDGLKEATGIDARGLSREQLVDEVRRRAIDDEALNGIDVSASREKGYIVLDLFDHYVGEHLVQPTFVIDYPRETSPLCKVHRDDPELIERFEPVICGMEMGNAYSELNDPVEQRRLLEKQAARLRAGLEDAQPMDEGFARAIEYGMPPTAGVGIGLDRMIMLLSNAASIRDVIAFPMMKPQGRAVDESTPEPVATPTASGKPAEVAAESAAHQQQPQAEAGEPVWNEPQDAGITVEQARKLLDEHITQPANRTHCLASAVAMRAMAKKLGRNPEVWYIAGLLHDLDMETNPALEVHGQKTRQWCLDAGVNPELVESMVAHNEAVGRGRQNAFEHLLAAVETLSGLIRAVALIVPDKKVTSVKARSVIKRMPEKRFAAGVDRDRIRECERAGVPVDDLVRTSLAAIQEEADTVGM